MADLPDFQSALTNYMNNPGPALAAAQKTASQAGLDPNNPNHLVLSLFSQNHAQNLNAIATNGGSTAFGAPGSPANTGTGAPDANTLAFNRIANNGFNVPTGGNEVQTDQAEEQNQRSMMQAQQINMQQQQQALQKLQQVPQLIQDSYVKQRVQEMNPTGDIDAQILSLQKMQAVSSALLRGQLMNLSPADRDAALRQNDSMFNDTLQTYQDVRTARMSSAKDDATEEFNMLSEQRNSLKDEVQGLKDAESAMEKQGASSSALASIRLKVLAAQKKANQTTGNPDAVSSGVSYLKSDYLKSNPGAQWTADLQTKAETIMKDTIKNGGSSVMPERPQGDIGMNDVQGYLSAKNLAGRGLIPQGGLPPPAAGNTMIGTLKKKVDSNAPMTVDEFRAAKTAGLIQ